MTSRTRLILLNLISKSSQTANVENSKNMSMNALNQTKKLVSSNNSNSSRYNSNRHKPKLLSSNRDNSQITTFLLNYHSFHSQGWAYMDSSTQSNKWYIFKIYSVFLKQLPCNSYYINSQCLCSITLILTRYWCNITCSNNNCSSNSSNCLHCKTNKSQGLNLTYKHHKEDCKTILVSWTLQDCHLFNQKPSLTNSKMIQACNNNTKITK